MFKFTQALTPRRRKWTWISALAFFTVAVALGLALGFTLSKRNSHGPQIAPNEPPESAFPDPVPINGTVPNNANWRTLDPGLIRRVSDRKLFLFTTGAWGEPNGAVWTADSLYGPWTKSPQPMLDQQAGAPQVYYIKEHDIYYMFHNHHFKYSTIGIEHPQADALWHDSSVWVQSSKTMEHGTWTAHGRLNITWQPKYNILDPSLITVENATTGSRANYLSFGSYQTGLYQVPLTDPPVNLTKKAMDLLTHLEHNTTRISTGPGAGINDRTEASFQYSRDGFYYLFFSSGICCNFRKSWAEAVRDPYRVMACRSDRPRGEFVDKDGRDCRTQNGGTEILGSHGSIFAPGGQGVMDDDEAGTIIYYHYVPRNNVTGKIEMGYRFGWNRLNFTSDGWPEII